MSMWDWLLNPAGLTAHGFCLSWAPGLVALHAGSDAAVGLAYLSIPLAIAAFTRQRPDIRYGWVAYLFVAFILACGATHLFSILTLWVPAYGVEGLVKLLTAVLSIATAIILWPLIPKVVALPSTAQLEAANAQLAATIGQQARTTAMLRASEAQVRLSNHELERRVGERTAELTQANALLTDALEERTAALTQRDLLLREVYHRVKNNLQMVDSLLVLQQRQLPDPDAKRAIEGLRSRIYALGLVHQQLMGSEDLKTFDIAPFLRELSANILDGGAAPEVNLTVRADRLEVGLDFGIPLGLLVTELVTNSLRHAFPSGKGNIEVVLEKAADGSILLVISDDGKGYGDKAPIGDGGRGLGTTLIRGLVAQLKGVMITQNDHGTRSEIRVDAPATA